MPRVRIRAGGSPKGLSLPRTHPPNRQRFRREHAHPALAQLPVASWGHTSREAGAPGERGRTGGGCRLDGTLVQVRRTPPRCRSLWRPVPTHSGTAAHGEHALMVRVSKCQVLPSGSGHRKRRQGMPAISRCWSCRRLIGKHTCRGAEPNNWHLTVSSLRVVWRSCSSAPHCPGAQQWMI